MDARNKRGLLITTAIALIGGTGFYVWWTQFRKPKDKEEKPDEKVKVIENSKEIKK